MIIYKHTQLLKPILNHYNKNKINFIFIVANLIVAFLGFLKSFIFIKFLNLENLGIITIIQTGAMFIGFFQIGLLNGGFRIISLEKNYLLQKINNVIFSYIGILSLVLFVIFFFNLFFNLFTDYFTYLFILLLGLSLLLFNWLTNILIAQKKLMLLNKLNLVSSSVSVLFLPLAYYYGLFGAAFCLLIQPIIFIVYALIASKNLRPSKYLLNIKEIREILKYGFIPFISGIFFLLQIQIERWAVVYQLGTEVLGKLYLVFLISALWVLVPSSISNLFFPNCVSSFESNNYIKFNNYIKNHFIVVTVYIIFTALIIFTLLEPVVSLFLPEHQTYLNFVYLAIPGLCFKTLSDPISIFLNSIVKLKPFLYSDIIGISFYVISIFMLINFKNFSLNSVIFLFNIFFLIKLVILLFYYLKLKNNIIQFNRVKINKCP